MTVNLGASANLIAGLNPEWDPRSGNLDILYSPGKPAMTTVSAAPVENRGTWSFPKVTLHETAISLLDELIPYRIVNPASYVDAPVIGAGALLAGMAGSLGSLETLSLTLGVNLTNPDFRFALVRMERRDGSAAHASAASGILVHVRPGDPDPAYGLTPEFTAATARLRHDGRSRKQDYGDRLTRDDASRFLESFGEFGTHYVSSVTFGDTIMQVFAYPRAQFDKIKTAYAGDMEALSGEGSQHFAQFTTSLDAGRFGFVKEYGTVLCLSNSARFRKTLEDGGWKDRVWSNRDSVFSIFNAGSSLSLFSLNTDFTDQTQTGIQLASLSLMIEQKRSLLWQRIFKGAMLQKYRTSVLPNFTRFDQRDFAGMLPEDQTGVISDIATPTVNVYKARLDLAGMQFVAASEVRTLVLFANVLSAESEAELALPGDDIRLFGQILDMRTDGGPCRSVVVADSAFDKLEIGCDEFLGALAIRNRSGSRYSVILDGLRFGQTGSGPSSVPVIEDDVRIVPKPETIPLLADSLQFSMAFAEAVASDQSSRRDEQIQAFVRHYLLWVAKMVPADSADPALVALRVRALDLGSFTSDPSLGSFVPILPASDYDRFIESILSYLTQIQAQIRENEQRVANRRLEERVIDVARTLNQNIVASGELITDVISANAAQQKDLERFYDGLIEQKRAEAAQQQTALNNLKTALFQAQGDVDLAVQKYRSAVEQWQITETVKFGLKVATDLFSVTAASFNPVSSISAVKELGELAQMIQKTLNILNATQNLYTSVTTGLAGLNAAQTQLDKLGGMDFGGSAKLNWNELSIHFKAILATGPDVKEAKTALDEAFSIMVMRGQAVAGAQTALHTILRDIYTSQQQKEINARQAGRLDTLKSKLRPADIKDLDRAGIDLMSLTGHLSFIHNQMLAILAKAFLQRDLALQYANLQPATPVKSFSLLKFRAALVQQEAATVEAKSALAHYQAATTQPVEFVIEGIDPRQMTGGNSLSSTIFLDAPEFYQYVDARIVSVVASVEGVKATDSGTYNLRLAYDGTPFHDRDLKRDPLTFRTPPRERIYGYDAASNRPTFSDGGESWSDGVSRLTPFLTWQVSFPNTKVNAGLTFGSQRLTVRLSFVLEARIVDAAHSRSLRVAYMAQDVSHPTALHRLKAGGGASAEAAPVARMLARGVTPPSREALLAAMYAQGSCTNGWDVVFNMGLDEIGRALAAQYEKLKTDTAYRNTIEVETREEQFPGVIGITRFSVEYGYPKLTFSTNNTTTATLEMEIVSGSVQYCSKIGDAPITCKPAQSLAGETLTADIEISKVAGVTEVDGTAHDVLSVILDMAQGTFSVSKMDLSDVTKVEFNAKLKAYFTANPVKFLINRLDLTHNPTLEALKPNDFVFKPYRTESGAAMLQLFIMTGGRRLPDYSRAFLNNVPEPLPQGQNVSMIVRSEIVFRDILAGSLLTSGWKLAGVDPGTPAKAWSGKFTAASVTGRLDLSVLNHSQSSTSATGSASIRYEYSIPGGNTVAWSLIGTTITPQADGQMKYAGSTQQAFSYNEHRCGTASPCPTGNCSACVDSTLASDVSVEVNAFLPLSVGGSGRDQTVSIATTSQGVRIAGHLSGGGASGTSDLSAQVNQQIQNQVPSQISGNLSIQFGAVSVFALKNLLFPADNYIGFESCHVPGDLLLLGNFTSAG